MIQELQEIGLNENEAKVYLQVLKDQGETASTIAKRAKINRTTVYLELDNLTQKGLVSYVIKNKKRSYQAVEPEKLIEILEEKKLKINKIMPRLKGMHKSINPFKIEVLEGKEGVKTLYNKIIDEAKEVCAFGVTGKANDILRFEVPHIDKKIKQKNMKIRYLANEDAKKQKLASVAQTKYMPKEIRSEITTIIFNDKVAIQSLVKENIFVTIITDEQLSKGYKNYFEFMWNLVE